MFFVPFSNGKICFNVKMVCKTYDIFSVHDNRCIKIINFAYSNGVKLPSGVMGFVLTGITLSRLNAI